MIGQSPPRKEDARLLRGRGKFVDDHQPPGTLYAAIVRSPHALARIIAIDKQAALQAGAHSVWVSADLPAFLEPLPLFKEPATNPYCDVMDAPPQLPLAHTRTCYVGEPVAVVLGDSAALAQDVAELLDIEYEALDAVVDPQTSLAGERQVHEGRTSNVAAHLYACIGDVDAAFAQADVVLQERYTYPRLTSVPIETRGIVAEYDPQRRTMQVHVGHQIPYALRAAAARATGLLETDITVLCPDTGGAFGPKSAVYPEDVLIPVLAHATGRPVKWIQTRSEFMLSSQHARDQIIDLRLAAKRDGTLLGLDVNILKDTGAYLCWAVIETSNTLNHLPSQYRIPAYRAQAHSVLTNKTPSAPYRGTGRPEAAWAIERSLDLLARRLNLDPITLRRLNLVTAEQMPYKPGNAYRDGVTVVYDTGDFPKVFNQTVAALDFDYWQHEQQRRREQQARLQIGMGVANYVEASGPGWPCEGATVRMQEDGCAEVLIGVSQSGQGHETAFAQVAAEFLGLPYEKVRVYGGDSRLLAHGFGTGGSRVTVNTGNAVALAAQEVKRRAGIVAAATLGCTPDELLTTPQGFARRDDASKTISWIDLVPLAIYSKLLKPEGQPGLHATRYYYPPTVTWATGTHAAVIEIDTETFVWKILDYAIGHDCGRQIHPKMVEGQVMGAFTQGLGAALGEQIVYSPEGQLLTGTLMDYVMPRAHHVPPVKLLHFEFPSTLNPLGVRGVGEGNVGPVAPAIANAIEDALADGLTIREPTLTAARLFELAQAQRSCQPTAAPTPQEQTA